MQDLIPRNIKIYPSNSFNFEFSTHINFEQCENILRNKSNGSFFLMQIETFNEENLINDIEYKIYDEENNEINLSECENEYNEIYYTVKQDEVFIALMEKYSDKRR